ncbi:MAG: cellulose biosynthesis cyclic di-GMP-binding regulatory protein BcsB [Paraclostridium sordellii]|uniref:cellulose biosynthesis cyclic di-GMP-binding regulatory protein BcsB n=1 Tax=Paraclostridium sordellii TaxID=1505 RepID=UPI000542A50D|nr:cellulose biosynthesis cyclic di-GMP-binding regulatory protein BcsB [Paeniclostridium sordellii]CEK33303.1 cell wall anchored protein,Cellulose synthase regulatory subunit,cellulose synthase regulator protein,Bacterial cellulose synthase subunit [[Clostridium] sordellii] [Paeniclostridium sordellii]CEP88344.1 cell wall anchored protein [[Clostridium] sordellii] [Paeniclostridium sordellii]
MRLITIIISLIISFSSFDIVFGQENVKNYRFENDITMSGVISSTNRYFDVPENALVKDAKLNLVYTKSELLDVNYSTITIIVNDVPIHSEKLGGNKEYKKKISVDIPKDLIKKGYNKVEIKAYKTISDKVCRDDSNTANWLVIHKESDISLNYNYEPVSNLISEYKDTYINLNKGNELETSILIPDNYSNEELTSAMIFANDFGEKVKYENIGFNISQYSQFKDRDKNIIYIGNGNKTSSDIFNLLTEKEKEKLNNNCVIKNVDSIFDKNKKMLLLISNNEELLKKASKLISSKNLIGEINEDSILINKDTDVDDIYDYKIKNTISFKDLGYDNITLKGPFTQETIIDANIPKGKSIKKGSSINLNFRYGENLDFERSLVTVYVNNIPIGSKKLSKVNANNDELKLSFPKEVLDQNYYQIKVVFNLELLDLACVTRDTENPFAYISNESYMEFDYNDVDDLNMKNYPYPFIKDDKVNDLVVVVPDKLSSNELTQIGSIMSYIGHGVKYNNGDIKFIKSSELNRDYKKSNLIVIGTPNNNILIKDLNKYMNLKFNKNYTGFESNQKIKFIGDYSSELATIQVLKSPYNKDKGMMILASTQMSDLKLSSRYLSDLDLIKSLKGDTIAIDREGNIKDLNYNLDDIDENKEIKQSNKLDDDSKSFIIIAGILFLMVAISTVLLALKYKNKNDI